MSTHEAPLRILLVGEAKAARQVRRLLEFDEYSQFTIVHVSDLELAVRRLSTAGTDIMLLAMGSKTPQGGEFIRVARAVAPDVPLVILSESEDEAFAVEAFHLGVQDFLVAGHLEHGALARSLRYSIERFRLQKMLQNLSLIDDLTGLQNRRGFLALAEQHLRMIVRKGAALLVYLDLDEFKSINDEYGHLEGNRALIVTANALRACFRQSDILARLGGDEFCVLMTDAGHDSAQQVRKRLQQRVDSINSPATWRFRISLSVGIVEVPSAHRQSLEELLRIADTRMYEEKRNKQRRASASPAQPAAM